MTSTAVCLSDAERADLRKYIAQRASVTLNSLPAMDDARLAALSEALRPKDVDEAAERARGPIWTIRQQPNRDFAPPRRTGFPSRDVWRRVYQP